MAPDVGGMAEPAADDRKARRNVAVLVAAQALGGAVAPISFALGAIAGHTLLGADKSLATLPITAFVVGTAASTVPAALLMRRIGRRAGFITGMLVGGAGGLLSALALGVEGFWLFCIGAFLAGASSAFVQQFRFAAADTASASYRPRAISLVLAGGIAAAVIGPQAVIYAGDLMPSVPFAGAFLAAFALSVAAAAVLMLLDIPRPRAVKGGARGRPIAAVARQPAFLVAVGCAISAYALMSFVMTAAPLAMVLHHHSPASAVLAIQWHVIAMFAPSFFTGSLIARFGAERIVAIGLLLLIGCALVALAGTTVPHFWAALILLGLGWNFGFIGGTTLVTETYRPEEKERVQALNDFLIFGFVALASFSSGEILVEAGWNAVNYAVLPIALLSLGGLAWRMLHQRPSPA